MTGRATWTVKRKGALGEGNGQWAVGEDARMGPSEPVATAKGSMNEAKEFRVHRGGAFV